MKVALNNCLVSFSVGVHLYSTTFTPHLLHIYTTFTPHFEKKTNLACGAAALGRSLNGPVSSCCLLSCLLPCVFALFASLASGQDMLKQVNCDSCFLHNSSPALLVQYSQVVTLFTVQLLGVYNVFTERKEVKSVG